MKKSRGLSNIKTILQNAFRRLGLSLRRFGRRGGIGGAIGRLALGVKRRDKRTITSLCAFFGLPRAAHSGHIRNIRQPASTEYAGRNNLLRRHSRPYRRL